MTDSFTFEGADGKTYTIPKMGDLSGYALEHLEVEVAPVLTQMLSAAAKESRDDRRANLKGIRSAPIFQFFRIVLEDDSEALNALMKLKFPEIITVLNRWLTTQKAEDAPLPNA